jgi:hypothetical protein
MKPNVIAFPACRMTPEVAMRRIREAAENTGLIGWCNHVFEKMGDEIVTRQVLTVLREGDLKKGPTWNEEYQDWVCVLRKMASGRTITLVVGVYERRAGITLVTVY